MAPLNESDLVLLFRRMRAYRLLYAVYLLSGLLYAAACAALALGGAAPPYRGFGGILLIYGAAVGVTVLLGRALLFTPGAFRRRNLEEASPAIGHIFQGLLFLLASGESLGLAAVTAAALGISTAWEASTVCLWQVLVGLALTPDRGHWDRLLSAWDRAYGKGGSDHVS